MIKKSLLVFVTLLHCFCTPLKSAPEEKVLNVFLWYGAIPTDVIEKFEHETGIKVNLDFYDNNDILEAKLLAGNTNYDVVAPSAWPFVARQVPAKLYRPIDPRKLSNYKNLDPLLLKKMQEADPRNEHVVPYFWGLVALAYDKAKVEALIPKEKWDSWALVFDEEVLKKLAPSGVTLLDDPVDVFLTYYIYKGENPLNSSLKLLRHMKAEFSKIRPYIKKFSNSLTPEQLANGELIVAMHWSEFLIKAKNNFKNIPSKPEIKVILPKEGTLMWIDSLAIPTDARHVENAYLFINFLLRADIAAQITNEVHSPTAVKASFPLIDPAIRNNKNLFPDEAYLKKVNPPEIRSQQFQRTLFRLFASLLTQKP
jgi:putrescine transport system substrate-binding protein